jgi:hypothetical protein
VKLARLRSQKSRFPSNADYRPKTNAAILLQTGHTKERLCKGTIGQGKETKHLNEVDVLSDRNEYRNFKLAMATMGRGLGRSEEDWKR